MSVFSDKIQSDLNKYYDLGESLLLSTENRSIELLADDYRRALRNVKSDIAGMVEKYPTYDEMIAYKRLEKLEKSISDTITQLTDSQKASMKDFLGKAVTDGYNTQAYALETSSMGSISFASMTEKTVALNKLNNYQRITWVDATTENGAMTIRRMNSMLSQGIIEGLGYQEIARTMSEQMNMAFYRMERIARTEIHKAQQFGRKLGFDEASKSDIAVNKLWISAVDERTRPNHLSMNRKTANQESENDEFRFDFVTMGGNAIRVDGPGLTNTTDDINCRCSLITQFPDIEDIENKPEYKAPTYSEFVERSSKVIDTPPAVVNPLADNLKTVEAEIRYNDYETGIAFHEDGTELLRKKGNRNSVRYTGIEGLKMENAEVYTHNHPGGSSFSGGDLEFGASLKIKEMRAVGTDYTYSIKGLDKIKMEIGDSLTDDYETIRDEIFPKYNLRALFESHRKLWHEQSNEIIETIAKKYGLEYTRTASL